ncbi:MAG TPA: hypothetical protein VF488_01835, partial [Gemmatimonadaceae bacterium]
GSHALLPEDEMQLWGTSRRGARVAASAALGFGAAAALAAASRTAPGNPHRTFGLLLLLVQLPGEALAHAMLARGDDLRAAPGETALAIAINAACYGLLLYLVLWRVGRRHTPSPSAPTAPAT